MRDHLVVGFGLLCALNAVRNPVFGMLAFVGFSLLNPHGLCWGYALTFPLAQYIAIGTLIGVVLSPELKRLPMVAESRALLALWVLFAITTQFADQPENAWFELKRMSKILLMVFLSMVLINTRERLRSLIRVMAVSLGLLGLKGGIFFVLTGGSQMIFGPQQSFLAGNNAFGVGMAMNFPLLYYLAQIETRPSARWFLRGTAGFTCLSVIGTFSRGAWLGLAASVGVVVWRSRYRILMGIFVVMVVLAAIPFMSDRVVDRYEDLREGAEEGSAQTRLWTWRFATNVALANPLLGAGFDYYGIEAYERYFPEFLDQYPGKVWSCHSVWFTFLSEHGVPGLMLWLLLLWLTFRSLRRLVRKSRTDPEYEWVRPYCHMIQASLMAHMVVGTFFDAAYFDLVYQLIAVVVILKSVASAPRKPAADDGDEFEAGAREPRTQPAATV